MAERDSTELYDDVLGRVARGDYGDWEAAVPFAGTTVAASLCEGDDPSAEIELVRGLVARLVEVDRAAREFAARRHAEFQRGAGRSADPVKLAAWMRLDAITVMDDPRFTLTYRDGGAIGAAAIYVDLDADGAPVDADFRPRLGS
ncbi:MAG: hypothetical protein LBR32_10355 [Propionibacteriaceae bacterium]|nr:hypothetical protein [Propionibacteriaceae bacterium]